MQGTCLFVAAAVQLGSAADRAGATIGQIDNIKFRFNRKMGTTSMMCPFCIGLLSMTYPRAFRPQLSWGRAEGVEDTLGTLC